MSRIVRTIALSGAAAAALFATAGTATASTPEEVTAVVQSAGQSVAGTPVALPSGKTIRVTGMDSVSYRADDSHRATVVTLADDFDSGGSGWVGTPPTNNGLDPRVGSAPQTGTYSPQQIQTQAGAGSVSITVAIGLALLIVVIVMVRGSKITAVQAILCVALGVYLAPTFVGPLIQQLGGSVGGSLGNIWAGF